jgi:hypothetical protein
MAGTAETFRALDDGTYGFLDFAAEGRQQASAALRPG